jgi:shikimate kinase
MLNTIFLIGYMGAGKSVIGRLLSQINDFNFYDLDEYIEVKEGKKVSEIFNENNEVYFRKIENKYLKEISLLKENKIISTGGGTPCFQNNFEIINESSNSTSIYLKANIDVLVNRLKESNNDRPLISHLTDEHKLKEFITKHLFERSYYYEKSKIKLVTDNLEPSEIVKLITNRLA